MTTNQRNTLFSSTAEPKEEGEKVQKKAHKRNVSDVEEGAQESPNTPEKKQKFDLSDNNNNQKDALTKLLESDECSAQAVESLIPTKDIKVTYTHYTAALNLHRRGSAAVIQDELVKRIKKGESVTREGSLSVKDYVAFADYKKTDTSVDENIGQILKAIAETLKERTNKNIGELLAEETQKSERRPSR